MKKKIIVGLMGLSLFATGTYAGTVIEQYKTPRGNIATVENLEIHKDRIGLTVNGVEVKQPTLFLDQSTYVPLRAVAEALGARVDYNSKTMSADITIGESVSTDSFEADGLLFSDIQVKKDVLDLYNVSANVKNTTGEDIQGAVLKIIFYDEKGARIGTATGAVTELESGKSKIVDFITMDDLGNYKTVKVQVDSKY